MTPFRGLLTVTTVLLRREFLRIGGRGDRSAAEETIEHPLVSAVPEQPLGALFRALFIIYHHISNSPYHRAIVAR